LINTFERGDHNFGCDCSLLDMLSSAVIEGISTDCVTRASEKIQAIIDEVSYKSLWVQKIHLFLQVIPLSFDTFET